MTQPTLIESLNITIPIAVFILNGTGPSLPFGPPFHTFVVRFDQIEFDTDGAELLLRYSNDGGSTTKQGATDYRFGFDIRSDDGLNVESRSAGLSSIRPTSTAATAGVSATAGRTMEGDVWIFQAPITGVRTHTAMRLAYERESPNNRHAYIRGQGQEVAGSVVDAIEFRVSVGNFNGGRVRVYAFE